MRDAHELPVEPQSGLQLAESLASALLSVLRHLREAKADADVPSRGGHHHNKTPRRHQNSNGAGPSPAPGALVNLNINPEREYEVNEVAGRLRISPQTVRKMIGSDRLKAERRGNGRGRLYIQGAEILRFTHLTEDQQP